MYPDKISVVDYTETTVEWRQWAVANPKPKDDNGYTA